LKCIVAFIVKGRTGFLLYNLDQIMKGVVTRSLDCNNAIACPPNEATVEMKTVGHLTKVSFQI
jgi:hypothetical protein